MKSRNNGSVTVEIFEQREMVYRDGKDHLAIIGWVSNEEVPVPVDFIVLKSLDTGEFSGATVLDHRLLPDLLNHFFN